MNSSGTRRLLAGPAAKHPFKTLRIKPSHEAAKRMLGGRLAVVAQQPPDLSRLGMNPLSDRRKATRAAQYGASNGGQHGLNRVAPSLSPTRIGNQGSISA